MMSLVFLIRHIIFIMVLYTLVVRTGRVSKYHLLKIMEDIP